MIEITPAEEQQILKAREARKISCRRQTFHRRTQRRYVLSMQSNVFRGAMRPVFGVIQTPTRASVTIYQSAASNFFLRAALACAMPAHASVLVVRRAPQH